MLLSDQKTWGAKPDTLALSLVPAPKSAKFTPFIRPVILHSRVDKLDLQSVPKGYTIRNNNNRPLWPVYAPVIQFGGGFGT